MIKLCNVVLHNSAVTVVNFEGTNVQFPAIKSKSEYVYVEHKDNKYNIVSKEDFEKNLNSTNNKKSKKKNEPIEDVIETEEPPTEIGELS